MVDVPLCVRLYASDARGMLVGLIAGLEEELRVMPRHRFNMQKIADREPRPGYVPQEPGSPRSHRGQEPHRDGNAGPLTPGNE